MNMDGMLELAEMAAKLEATARKLPQALRHDELLRDIERFRAQLAAELAGLKAKRK